MEKSEYFKSPHPRNIISNQPNKTDFYSPCDPFKNIHHQDEQLFQNNLFSPGKRNRQSPFHLYSAYLEQESPIRDCNSQDPKPKSKLIEDHINFEEQNEEENGEQMVRERLSDFEIETPYKIKSELEIGNIKTSARKKYELREFPNQQKQHLSRDNEKGLRGLSKQAFEVLKNSDPLTYQEVAQRIIQQNDEFGQSSNKKQSLGIKRRVYDALNVLIAVGLLEKNGRKISFVQKNMNQNQKVADIKKTIKSKLRMRVMAIQMKQNQISRLIESKQSLRKLVQRNIDEQKVKKVAQRDKIYFPFALSSGFSSQKSTQNKIVFDRFICGDLDAISYSDFLHKQ